MLSLDIQRIEVRANPEKPDAEGELPSALSEKSYSQPKILVELLIECPPTNV